MTESTTIARPYAKAAFEYAKQHGVIGEWSQQLQLLAAIVSDSRMKELLNSPKLTKAKRAKLIIEIGDNRLNQPGMNFIKLLAANSRLLALPNIVEEFERYRAELEGTIDATLVSAQAVTGAQLEKIGKALEKRLGRKVNLQSKLDESLIGGAVIKAGDLVIDGSVKDRLAKLSTALLH